MNVEVFSVIYVHGIIPPVWLKTGALCNAFPEQGRRRGFFLRGGGGGVLYKRRKTWRSTRR